MYLANADSPATLVVGAHDYSKGMTTWLRGVCSVMSGLICFCGCFAFLFSKDRAKFDKMLIAWTNTAPDGLKLRLEPGVGLSLVYGARQTMLNFSSISKLVKTSAYTIIVFSAENNYKTYLPIKNNDENADFLASLRKELGLVA